MQWCSTKEVVKMEKIAVSEKIVTRDSGDMICFVCGKPVDLTKIHYSMTEQMERDEAGGSIQPLYGNYIAVAHKKCRSFKVEVSNGRKNN